MYAFVCTITKVDMDRGRGGTGNAREGMSITVPRVLWLGLLWQQRSVQLLNPDVLWG